MPAERPSTAASTGVVEATQPSPTKITPLVLSEGPFSQGGSLYLFLLDREDEEAKRLKDTEVTSLVKKRKRDRIIAAGVAGDPEDVSSLWFQDDVLPFVHKPGDDPWEVSRRFTSEGIAIVPVDPKTKEVHPFELAPFEAWRRTFPEKDMEMLELMIEEVGDTPIIDISSTKQGGGVAIMNADKIRAVRAYNNEQRKKGTEKRINNRWIVMIGELDPVICDELGVDPATNPWETTKFMHNTNQAQADGHLTQQDENVYQALTETNIGYLSSQLLQPNAVYIFHDAQPAGMIRDTREKNPDALIFWRLHIALHPDLIADPDTPQSEVWGFIRDKLRDEDGREIVDAIQVHPSRPDETGGFLPYGTDALDPSRVVHRTATLSEVDGLGKKLTPEQEQGYIDDFNDILVNGIEVEHDDESRETFYQTALDPDRKVVGQIARKDESKNIPGVIASYKSLRDKWKREGKPEEEAPQLIIAGHAADDDPSGLRILRETLVELKDDKYAEIRDDIKVARLPHVDQMLNAIGERIDVALQLSWAEACEVKVNEYKRKRKPKPVIVSNRGGLPRQIKHGVDGYVVEPDDHEAIANHMFDLLTDPDLYENMSKASGESADPEYTTLADLRDWLGLVALHKSGRFAPVMAEQREKLGRQPFVRELLYAEYGERVEERLQAKKSSETVVFDPSLTMAAGGK